METFFFRYTSIDLFVHLQIYSKFIFWYYVHVGLCGNGDYRNVSYVRCTEVNEQTLTTSLPPSTDVASVTGRKLLISGTRQRHCSYFRSSCVSGFLKPDQGDIVWYSARSPIVLLVLNEKDKMKIEYKAINSLAAKKNIN